MTSALVVGAAGIALVPAGSDLGAVQGALDLSLDAGRAAVARLAWGVVVDRTPGGRTERHGDVPLEVADGTPAEATHETLIDVETPESIEIPVAAPPAVPPAAPDGDHDGATVSLAQLRAMRAQAPGDHDGATIARSAITRPVAMPRIRLSTGETHTLARPVIIGRAPRLTRVPLDDAPLLVTVASPELDISRSHVEIVPDHDAVVVTDLRTTNGTRLVRDGADPVRLRAGEATVVVTGDVLDLGDGVTVAFEDLP
ncbi:FHA domain-containing protein [Microbacterium excoecariae]|uniref:FHA domain-containing protein n=1 Tax=Microbacterium excoecariae TaxID=2715210 RepID=UPI0030B8D218